MRVNFSLKLAFGMLVVLTGGRMSLAQAPGIPAASGRVQIGSPSASRVHPMYSGATAQSSSSSDYNSVVGRYPQNQFDKVDRSNVPEFLLPSPDMSPFNLSYDQHVNENGLWMNESNRRVKKYFLTAEYLRTKTRRPTGLVGNPLAATYLNTIEVNAGAGAGVDGAGTPIDQLSIGDALEALGVDISLFQGQIPPGQTVGPPPVVGSLGFNLYDRQSLSVFGNVNSNGARVRWGWWNPDNGGVTFTAWWSSEVTDTFDARNTVAAGRGSLPELTSAIIREFQQQPDGDRGGLLNVPIGSSLTGELGDEEGGRVLEQNLLNLRGLPLDDGTLRGFSDGFVVGGLTAPFDLQFKVDFTVETGGGSANWMMSPIRRFGKLQLRPVMGLRYMYVREEFGFLGQDSGFSYSGSATEGSPDIKLHSVPNFIDDDLDGIIDNAGTQELGGGGGGGGGDDAGTFLPTNLAAFPELYPITSFLNSRAQSHLAGPEVGIQYDIAGKRFSLWGQTKVALLANHERLRMDGDNIGMVTRPGDFVIPDATDPFPNRFGSRENHSHVSPLIETSIIFEMDIFAYLPLMKKIQFLREATFRTGYTYTYVGEVVAPEGSIAWQGNPRQGLFPVLDVERTKWTVSSFNFGLQWNY